MAPASAVTPAAATVRPSAAVPVRVGELAAAIGATLLRGDPGIRVSGVTLRTSDLHPGDLFAALAGSRVHGADFATEALAAGATALLTDPAGAARPTAAASDAPVLVHPDPRAVLGPAAARVYGEPSVRLAVLGVTGTAGKTSTVHLLEGALRAAGAVTGLIGTVETRIGGQRLPSAFTTPEAPDLQRLLAVMVERGVSHVPMEVSSHALALGRVDATAFAVAAFTNLSQDHLDFHADMAGYFAAKARLFDGRARAEVVCIDDGWGRRLVRPHTVTVSAARDGATWRALEVTQAPEGGQRFRALGPSGVDVAVAVALPGRFSVANALLALAVAHAVGVEPADAARGLAGVSVPGRMQRVEAGQPFLALVDYAHKPAAVAALLDTVRAASSGRVLVVLGCGGERDATKRPLMGEAAARRADLLVVTDDNPRGEDPAAIRAAVLVGARGVAPRQRGEVLEVGDRRAAIAAAVAAARPGDVLVVAGKGHESEQEVGREMRPFSDAEELAAALQGRGDW